MHYEGSVVRELRAGKENCKAFRLPKLKETPCAYVALIHCKKYFTKNEDDI